VRDVRSIEREILQLWIQDNNKRRNREVISIPMERNEVVYIPIPCCGSGTAYVLLTMAVDT
jgi:hypothetical protein